jgi:3-isopropylmalate/(R)-2-methylmalate dehydratase small subunit
MEPFVRLTAVAVPLMRVNVDTDAIIPGTQLMKMSVSNKGFGWGLFYNWRYREDGSEDPEFVLNTEPYRNGRILIAGQNFACGSSREPAVWALRDYGFRCVIAPSYGSIFYANAPKNGVLPIILREDEVRTLADEVERSNSHELSVDLESCEVVSPSQKRYRFSLIEIYRQALLHGLDPIAATLRFSEEIGNFQKVDEKRRSWAYPKHNLEKTPA